MKTSVNIKPCNLGCSELHNRRSAEYMRHINKDAIYIRKDLSYQNEVWVSSEMRGKSLQERYDEIAKMVKEKTGRAMQTKDRERKDKKTGKVRIVRGSTPLKEGVAVIQDDTAMEQLLDFCKACNERWGITALQIYIHRDEGHYSNPEDRTAWKPNYHAHILWDWMDHTTGKSLKLDDRDMSEMQSILAKCLNMQRGISKTETDRRHLERADFIVAKHKQEAEQAIVAKNQAEDAKRKTENENLALVQKNIILDSELVDKKRKIEALDKENTENIKAGLANIFGKGKYAAIERENQTLKAENKRIKSSFLIDVESEVDKRTRKLVAEKQEAETKRDIALAQNRSLTIETDETVRRLKAKLKDKENILNAIANVFYQTNEIFRGAITAIISFGSQQYKSIFSPSEAADIKNTMLKFGKTIEMWKTIGDWLCQYAKHRQPFDKKKYLHTLKEVGDVAEGLYDRKIGQEEKGIPQIRRKL